MKKILQPLIIPAIIAIAGLLMLQQLQSYAVLMDQLDRQTAAALSLVPIFHDHVQQAQEDTEFREVTIANLESQLARRVAVPEPPEADLTTAQSAQDTITAIEATNVRLRLAFIKQAVQHGQDTTDLRRIILLRTTDRDQWRATAILADSVTIPALEIALKAERDARQCTILFMPCPSRTMMFVGGVVVTGTVFLLRP